MKLLFWNLEKRGLAPWAMQTFKPDVALFQEHWLRPNFSKNYFTSLVYTTESYRKKGSPCGTAVYTDNSFIATNVKRMVTTQKEFFISMRKTATAIEVDGKFWAMSVHAFNGWPFRSVEKFTECIKEFMTAIPPNVPAIVAGDFNTFSIDHLEALDRLMTFKGFARTISLDYDGKKKLDHVYVRKMVATLITTGFEESDHPYGLLDVSVLADKF